MNFRSTLAQKQGGNMNRRDLLAGLGAGLLSVGRAAPGLSASTALAADDGSPIRNFAIPSRLALADLPGLTTRGAAPADVVVFEIFDYNCGYCRRAAEEIDTVLRHDAKLALALVHHPILSPASLEAARVQQTILRRHGAERAYAFHLALFSARGFIDGAKARAIAADMGLDAGPSERAEERARVEDDLVAQRRRVADLGLRMTPSFVIADTAFIGWPGSGTLRDMVASARRCGTLRCS
jgi:protein-disulfide isomerase